VKLHDALAWTGLLLIGVALHALHWAVALAWVGVWLFLIGYGMHVTRDKTKDK
jgi:hypothetical protein